ncbi:hypothetical protein LRS05_16475 [Flavobacterium sp. J372]|nr:hypothetical protein [Flavobacterium sp. J372]MCR5863599.1 hypothetical protein [Flavobacterium sp. J372]
MTKAITPIAKEIIEACTGPTLRFSLIYYSSLPEAAETAPYQEMGE